MSRAAALLALCALLALSLGCAAKAGLNSKVQFYQERMDNLAAQGAQDKAPRETARAIAHLDAAREEIAERDYDVARDHLVIVERNLDKADYYLNAPQTEEQSKDLDTDGIPDQIDLCPTLPETVNGYQDDDGCPDLAF